MGVLSLTDKKFSFQSRKDHGHVVEEISGLIKVYKDGHVERFPAVVDVPSSWSSEPRVVCKDVVINQSTGVWARLHIPNIVQGLKQQLPLLIYFHGGGFCVGSASWKCYHEFLSRLAKQTNCVVVSVNYRLAPEHRLPAAYEDGLNAFRWVQQQDSCRGCNDLNSVWSHCNFNQIFIAGDSAGASIAYNVAISLSSQASMIKGVVLIQPFFSSEARTSSEKSSVQSSRSALSLTTSDCYWRLALPAGCNRDHPLCNPLSKGFNKIEELRIPPLLVCISELDILKDSNLEFCRVLRRAGKSVKQTMYAGVGHAFQVLHNYQMSQARTHEMLTHFYGFINNR